MPEFTIDDIIRKAPTKGVSKDKDAQKALIQSKLAEVEYLESYNEMEKDAVVKGKNKLANFCMKRALDDKMAGMEFGDVVAELIELSEAIAEAKRTGTLETVVKLYLTAKK